MRQVLVKLNHPVTRVRRDAVAALRRHNDGPGLEAPDAAEPATEGRGDARMLERLTGAFEQLVTQCQLWNRSVESRLRESQTLAIEVGVAVAEKLLHAEISQGRHDVEQLVAAALAASGSRKPALVKLSAADEQRLTAAGITARLRDDTVQIVADPLLSDGNAELELPGYSLVFDWHHELDTIKRNLLNDLSHAEH